MTGLAATPATTAPGEPAASPAGAVPGTGDSRSALQRLLSPRSIAVFGGRAAEEVIHQCRKLGFAGDIWPVHPSRTEMAGLPCYPDVAALPGAPDAAFVAVPRHATVEVVGQLSARGAGGAICYASGFAEVGGEGLALQQALVAAAGEMALIGPNCYGLLNYLDGVALWPDQHGGERVQRGVAIITQSGNIGLNLTMQRRGLPLGLLITVGNKAGDSIDALIATLLRDPRVSAIGLHLEGLDDVAAFSRVAIAALHQKVPLVVLKAGSSELGARTTMSHTSSLAGPDKLYDALFQRLGVARVYDVGTLLETLKFLHVHGALGGNRIASASCSGGEASLVADLAWQHGLAMPTLPPAAHATLLAVLGEKVTIANPLDYHTYIWGDLAAQTACFAGLMQSGCDCCILVLDFPRADRCNGASWHTTLAAFAAAQAQTGTKAVVLGTLPENLDDALCARLIQQGIAPMQGTADCMRAIALAAQIGTAQTRTTTLLPITGHSLVKPGFDRLSPNGVNTNTTHPQPAQLFQPEPPYPVNPEPHHSVNPEPVEGQSTKPVRPELVEGYNAQEVALLAKPGFDKLSPNGVNTNPTHPQPAQLVQPEPPYPVQPEPHHPVQPEPPHSVRPEPVEGQSTKPVRPELVEGYNAQEVALLAKPGFDRLSPNGVNTNPTHPKPAHLVQPEPPYPVQPEPHHPVQPEPNHSVRPELVEGHSANPAQPELPHPVRPELVEGYSTQEVAILAKPGFDRLSPNGVNTNPTHSQPTHLFQPEPPNPTGPTSPPYMLDEVASKAALAAFGLPIPTGQCVPLKNVATAAQAIGLPVVVKAVSNTLAHKTEVGGVALNLHSAAAAQAAAERMGHLSDRFLVEAMTTGAVAEIIVGIQRDPQFGLTLTIGTGGVLVELLQDAATLLLPVSEADIEDALQSLKTWPLLNGYRGRASGDVSALVNAIASIAAWAEAHAAQLQALDVNPLLVLPAGQGAVAVDAVIYLTLEPQA